MAFANANGNPFLHTGGIGGISPSADYISQWVNWTCPTYNSTTGFWEIEDKTGTSNIKVTNSNEIAFDGIDDFIFWSNPLINNIGGWSINFNLKNYVSVGTAFIIGGQSTRNNIAIRGQSDLVAIRDGDGTYHNWDGTGNTVAVVSSSLQNGDFDMFFSWDGTNLHLWVDSDYKGYVTPNLAFKFSTFGYGYTTFDFVPEFCSRYLKVWTSSETPSTETAPSNYYTFSEGAGTTIIDKGASKNNGVATNITLSLFWIKSNSEPYNLVNGFDLWEHATLNPIRVPFDMNGNSILTDGDTPPETGYTWVSKHNPCSVCEGHNGAESTLTQYEVAELITADARQTTPYWFDGGGTAQDISYPFPANNDGEYIVMSDVDTANCNKNLLLINRDLTNSEKEALQLYLNQIEAVFDSNNIPIEVEGEGQLYVLKSTYTE